MEWETAFSSGVPSFQQKQPYLEIMVQPQTKFRFRYRSEMTGKHGSLLGAPQQQQQVMMRGSSQFPVGGCTVYPSPGPSGSSCSSGYGLIPTSDLSSSSGGSTNVSAHIHHAEGSGSLTSASSFVQTQPMFSSNNGSKFYPTVKLHNAPGDAIIRCSLVCDTPPYYPHPHLLEMGHGTGTDELMTSGENCYVEAAVNANNDHTAVFQGLNIIYVSKKGIRKQLLAKMSQLSRGDNRRVTEERVDDLSLGINLNVVCLYFEAFTREPMDPNSYRQLCPAVVSTPIQHNKSTQTGELRIVRIDKHASCCTGDEEVFILVEKVDKHNIQVKFFQENDQGQEIWKAYGKFSKLDVHHQYAIVFKTPPYRSFDIDTEVEVQVQLERPSDSATSASLPFIYKPIERLRKMPKRQSSRTGSDSGRGRGPGPSSGNRGPMEFPEAENEGEDPFQQPGDKQGGNNLGTSSVRQGSNQMFPCDVNMLPMVGDTQSKVLAVNVALSVCQGLHSWAETSDLNSILSKLRHLLCIVNENGDNALHTAIYNKQWEPFKKILETVEASPDISYLINEPNLNNLTPVALAASMNAVEFVEELINHKADITIPNSDGDTPLHIAVKRNNVECVKCLLKSPSAQTIIDRYNYSSMTVLHIAALNGYVDILKILCNQKSALCIQEGTYGRTPLHLVVDKEETNNVMCVICLLKAAEDSNLVNIQNYRGDTALHQAASLGHKTLCALLLHFGADPLIENFIASTSEEDDDEEEGNGQTVFDVAANEEIKNVLMASSEEWAKVYHSCSIYLTELTSADRESNEGKVLTADSIFLDSGINITDLNIS